MEIALNSLFVSHENPIFEGDFQFWDIVEYPKMGIYNTQQDGHWEQSHIPNLGNVWVFLGIILETH